MPAKLPLSTLILLISFASVNAVLFTPALPDIAKYFLVDENAVQHTITWFLVGYAFGQLLYGPIANRFGRKPALYAGISLQVISSLICVISAYIHTFEVLVLGRLLLALGSGVGLKMTFTLVSECYDQLESGKLTSYLMTAFAITPGLAVAVGGFLNHHFGWVSCFYAGAIYGLILLALVTRLPETLQSVNINALKWHYLQAGYGAQFKNSKILVGGLLIGCATTFVYGFAALAPFIAINIYGMTSIEYGSANLIPSIGLLAGSLLCAQLTKHYPLKVLLILGIGIAFVGTCLMLLLMGAHQGVLASVFVPMVVVYFGLSFVMSITSTLTMSQASDKAYGSAVMSFLNMGFATLIVLSLGFFSVFSLLLPSLYTALSLMMFVLLYFVLRRNISAA